MEKKRYPTRKSKKDMLMRLNNNGNAEKEEK